MASAAGLPRRIIKVRLDDARERSIAAGGAFAAKNRRAPSESDDARSRATRRADRDDTRLVISTDMSDPAPRPTTTTTTTTFVKLQQTVDELERELETAESRLKTRRSDIVTLEENLDAERALAKRLRGEFADVLAEIATTKAALMKSNFEIEDVLREIEPHRRHSIGEPSPGAPETIEETDAEAPDPEPRAASRRDLGPALLRHVGATVRRSSLRQIAASALATSPGKAAAYAAAKFAKSAASRFRKPPR